MTKNDHQEGPRIAKNAEKPTLENLKNQKNGEKKAFWGCRFLIVFLNTFFDGFWVSTAPPGGSQNRFFRFFFRFFCSPVASELLLGSPGTVSGQFFIDFRLILAPFWSIFCRFFLSICCRSVAHLGPILDCFFLHAHAFKCSFWPPSRKKNSD